MYTDIYKFILFLLCEVILYIGINFFYKTFLGNFIHKKRSYIIFAIYVTLNITKYFFQSASGFIWLFFSIILETFVGYCYCNNHIRILMFSLLNCVLNALSESISAITISFVFQTAVSETVNNDLTYTVAIFLSRFLFLTVTYNLYMYKLKNEISKVISHFWPIIAVFTVGTIYMLYIMYSVTWNNAFTSYPKIIFMYLTLAVFNLTVYYLFNRQCKDSLLKDEIERLNKYIDIQAQLSEETLNNADRIATMKHDLKNLFLSLYSLINSSKYDEVERIVKENVDFYSITENSINTCDNVLNTIVNYKRLYAKNHGLECNIDVNITTPININSDDLSIAFGNCIDNATEYLMKNKTGTQLLTVNISYLYDVLSIIVSNPVVENIEIPDDYLIPSTKSGNMHGYGIKSMKKITEEYNGSFEISCKDYVFTITMTFICNKHIPDNCETLDLRYLK